MYILKPVLTLHAITACVMTAALTIPCVVQAVSFGEVTTQSKLGWPLLERVDLMLGIAAIALGLVIFYFFVKIKSLTGASSLHLARPILKPADDAAGPKMEMPRIVKPSRQARSDQVPAVVATHKASTAQKALPPAAPHLNLQKIDRAETGEHSMLKEAELYVANGRLANAIEILLEIIKRHPSKSEAWLLLLSVYSSLGKVTEFENTARKFLSHHKASPSWSEIQVLGRTLDHDNPLYSDQNNHVSASPLAPDMPDLHHPIGDVLVEMGVLSRREVMKHLDDFDQKKHGRFGGFLVARKAITLAQLDQALLQQQGTHSEISSSVLPSLQDIENFLIDFDPSRHGSVGKFMVSRNAVTPEQLSHLLHQQSSIAGVARVSQADEPTPLDKGPTLELVLESTP